MTPLTEVGRIKLLPAYIGDVRAWKADDAPETTVIAVKNPAVDSDDTSFYAATKTQLLTGQLSYLGTTALGKDGGCQPLVFNDGRVVLLTTEAPQAGDPGSLAALYAVTLQYRVGIEPVAGTGTVDQVARSHIQGLAAALAAAAAQYD